MTNERLASTNPSDDYPGTRPGPLTALGTVVVVGGGFIIYYWSAIKAALSL